MTRTGRFRPASRTTRILLALLVASANGVGSSTPVYAQSGGASPVIFVHGMGSNAAEIGTAPKGANPQFADLLTAIAKRHPRPGVCQKDAQPDRPWDGSPCVFRFVEDIAEASEPGAAARGPNDSQSGVQENADKLAREVGEVSKNADGRRVILIGYSMGGAIIRTFLATHKEIADKRVAATILVDGVTSGSWGYAFATSLPKRFDGSMEVRLTEMMRSLAASASAVDFTRPATRDLSPRSRLFRTIAPRPLPDMNYYTFWGDIRIVISRKLLVYDLPSFEMPSLGDLGLLAGDPDPTKLPELGGQRFSPKVSDEHEALDIRHATEIELDSSTITALIDTCGRRPRPGGRTCEQVAGRMFQVPNAHTAIPFALGRVTVDVEALGGKVTLLEAMLAAVARNQDGS